MSTRKSAEPYLSVVVTARNDNHGGDMLGRMQMFVDGFLDQCDQFKLPAELIVVDWNPPGDKPPLMDAIKWPDTQGWGSVRFITVPPERHLKLDNAKSLPLFQMIAKNVGIRRARGEFVMATNIDILFSDELFHHFAQRRLKNGRCYRCDRWDVLPHPDRELAPKARLAWCREHTMRFNELAATRMPNGDTYPIYWPDSWKVCLLEWLQDRSWVPIVTRKRLHTNACGDMTLMHRDGWQSIHGYTEREVFSMHIDSWGLNAAVMAGYKQVCLSPPAVIYHLEHDVGSGWSQEGQDLLDARLEAKGIPQISFEKYHYWCIQMRRGHQPSFTAAPDWGWSDETLPEASPW